MKISGAAIKPSRKAVPAQTSGQFARFMVKTGISYQTFELFHVIQEVKKMYPFIRHCDVKIDFAKTIKNPAEWERFRPLYVGRPVLKGIKFLIPSFFHEPEISRPTALHFPPVGGRGAKMLNGYMEKKIGGVLYRVHSIYAGKGDFQALSESLLESRVMKHYGKSCAKDAAGS